MEDKKKDFSLFENYRAEHKDHFIYLDSAASSLTPDVVIDTMNAYYTEYRSNIDRGLYKTAQRATQNYEHSRKRIANHINANDDELILTGGSTLSSNMLVQMLERYFEKQTQKGDQKENKSEIIVSIYAHHSDLLPLQEYAKRKSLRLQYAQSESEAINLINEHTLLVSCPLASNVTGEIFDIASIAYKAKTVNAYLISDMTAAVGHTEINVKGLGIDAGYFSMHKACGPTGVGALYMRRDLLRDMDPTLFGGGMVWEVGEISSSYRSDVKRFEAGTANIAGVIGSGSGIEYIESIGIHTIRDHIETITEYAMIELEKLEKEGLITLYAKRDVKQNVGIISFDVKGIHPHDVAEILGELHIAIRAGHHCTQPLMRHLEVKALNRASFYIYNTKEDIDMLVAGIRQVVRIFKKQ